MSSAGEDGRGPQPPAPSALSGMRLTELLDEVQERLATVARTQGRVQGLVYLASILLKSLMLVAGDHQILRETADFSLNMIDPLPKRIGMAAIIVVLAIAPGIAAGVGLGIRLSVWLSIGLNVWLRIRLAILCSGRNGDESRCGNGDREKYLTHLGSPFERLMHNF